MVYPAATVLVLSRLTNTGAQLALREAVAGRGAGSIKEVVVTDGQLGGLCAKLQEGRAAGGRLSLVDGIECEG